MAQLKYQVNCVHFGGFSIGPSVALPEAVWLEGQSYCVFISNRSPTTSSKTIIHDARILDCVTVISSEIPFRTNRPTIAHQ